MLDQPANSRLRSHARPVRPRLRPLYDFEPRQRFLSRLDRAQGAPTGLEVNWTDGLELVTRMTAAQRHRALSGVLGRPIMNALG